MADTRNDGLCGEKSGFLFSHKCDRMATGQCASCQKSICDEHTHSIDGKVLCSSCAKKLMRRDERNEERSYRGHYRNPFFYGYGHYHGYGYYGHGYWGHHRHHHHHHHDPNDLTEADGQSVVNEGEDGWEQDMGES